MKSRKLNSIKMFFRESTCRKIKHDSLHFNCKTSILTKCTIFANKHSVFLNICRPQTAFDILEYSVFQFSRFYLNLGSWKFLHLNSFLHLSLLLPMQNIEQLLLELDSPSNVNQFINDQFSKGSADRLQVLFDQMIGYFLPFCQDPALWTEILQIYPCTDERFRTFPIVFFITKWIDNYSKLAMSAEVVGSIAEALKNYKALFEEKEKLLLIGKCIYLFEEQLSVSQNTFDISNDSTYSTLPTILQPNHKENVYEILISCLFAFFPVKLTDVYFEKLCRLSSIFGEKKDFPKIIGEYFKIMPTEYIESMKSIPECLIEAVLSGKNSILDSLVFDFFKHLPKSKCLWQKSFSIGTSPIVKNNLLCLLDGIFNGGDSLDCLRILLEVFQLLQENLKRFLINCFEKAVKLKNDVWRVSVAVVFLSNQSVKYSLLSEEQLGSVKRKNTPLMAHQLVIRSALTHAFHTKGFSDFRGNVYFLLDSYERTHRCDEVMLTRAVESLESRGIGDSDFEWLLAFKMKEYASKRPPKINRSWLIIEKVKEIIIACQKNVQSEVVFVPSKYQPTLNSIYDFNGNQDSKLLALIQSRIGQSDKFRQSLTRLLNE